MTELIWDGKYKDGKKVAPVRIALPFQTVETVNETAQERQLTLDMLYAGHPSEWRNRLIWGDKKYVLPSLLPEFAGKVNLIYIDPPFATGADFSFTAIIPESNGSLTKEPSIIEQKAYRDTWGRGIDSYLQWLYETIVLLRELLADDGSMYVHLDWHVGHNAKSVLDEVFGMHCFVNEIVWKRSTNTSSIGQIWKRAHDTILFYSKSDTYDFNFQYKALSETSIELYQNEDEKGQFQLVPLLVSGKRGGTTGQPWKGIDPNKRGKTGMHWITRPEKLDQYLVEGLIVFPDKEGGIPRLKYYLTDNKGVVFSDLWDDINLISSAGKESLNYPTQKPESLLERIIKASSNEGDLILDCFCGSGTTAAVAEKLGRRWITCDLGRFAIQTTRKRLLSIDNVRPFVVQNLGKYERQAWQTAEFDAPTQRASVQLRYRKFILQLYQATPVDGYSWLHGVKNGRLVHVGSVDAPIALGEVTSIVNEFWRVRGKDVGEHTNGIDVLGWDFAFDLNETAKQMAADSNIRLSFKKIPREVLEKKAVEQGDIAFYELAALDVAAQTGKKSVAVELKNFFMPPDDVPEDVKNAITHWRQWIDYWAIDWDYREDTFHNQWQSYRTRKQPDMLLKASHEYEQSGTYTIVIKVIDILGNDTTKAIAVEVA
ncbi:MAG TPA: site-specific DNA-methyltransferase [Ktedonobacteraceae bacterium]|nr:site-specific DNA-methyltransferase [Ktedonobacteraceae bacterium]